MGKTFPLSSSSVYVLTNSFLAINLKYLNSAFSPQIIPFLKNIAIYNWVGKCWGVWVRTLHATSLRERLKVGRIITDPLIIVKKKGFESW